MGKVSIAAYVDEGLDRQLREMVANKTFRTLSAAIEHHLNQSLNRKQER